jgi:hypothetical protein
MSAEGLTFRQLIDRVAVNLQSVNAAGAPVFVAWLEAWIKRWINDGYTEVCSDSKALERYVTFVQNPNPVLSSNPTAEYVPANVEPTALDQVRFVQVDKYRCYPKNVEALFEEYFDWDTRTAGVPLWLAYNTFAPGVLKIVPDPGVAFSNVRGLATLKPPLLVADGDVPLFDSEYHNLLEFYATSRAFAQGGENQNLGEAERYLAMFEKRFAKFKVKTVREFSADDGGSVPYRNV